ncbi:hypothetical protein cypCar_00003034 [Cyprinus carpio]|nr:hypothetical protein cypCar_00003034 [Cyprinus carpio]
MHLSSQRIGPFTGQFKYRPHEGAQHTPASVEGRTIFNFLFGAIQEDEVMATVLGPESPWMGGKKRTRNRNIISKLRQSQIAGRGFSRGTQLPEALLQERDKRAKWHGIPVLLQELYESSHLNSDFTRTHTVLKELSSLLSMEAMSFVTEDRKTAQESTFPNTYTFDLFGGVDVSVKIIPKCKKTTILLVFTHC